MSRYGDDEDRYGIDDLPANADCSDCGVSYSKATDDPTTWCDSCSNLRDRWAEALELRTMLKAALRADLTKVKDIA